MFINLIETKTGIELPLSHELASPNCSDGAVFHGSFSLAGHTDRSAGAIVNVMLKSFDNMPPSKAVTNLKHALRDLTVSNPAG